MTSRTNGLTTLSGGCGESARPVGGWAGETHQPKGREGAPALPLHHQQDQRLGAEKALLAGLEGSAGPEPAGGYPAGTVAGRYGDVYRRTAPPGDGVPHREERCATSGCPV